MAITVHLDSGLGSVLHAEGCAWDAEGRTLEILGADRRVIAEYNANVWTRVELTANEEK